VLGPSTVMGWGVGDGGTFEALLEERLNREPVSRSFKHVELMNFGVPGYQPPQQLVMLEKTLKLQPNALFYIAVGREVPRSVEYMAAAVRKGFPIPYPSLQAIVDKAGVRRDMDETTAIKHLEPFGTEILKAVYDQLGQLARERGIRPVWIFVPQVREGRWQDDVAASLRVAREAGFTIVNVENVFQGRDVSTIRLADWDDHPNALGHQLVADRLYAELAANPDLVFAPAP
jgi:hypothetical protein